MIVVVPMKQGLDNFKFKSPGTHSLKPGPIPQNNKSRRQLAELLKCIGFCSRNFRNFEERTFLLAGTLTYSAMLTPTNNKAILIYYSMVSHKRLSKNPCFWYINVLENWFLKPFFQKIILMRFLAICRTHSHTKFPLCGYKSAHSPQTLQKIAKFH